MNEQEKSLKLAELAEWEEADATNIWTGEDLWNINSHYCPLEPYQNTRDGLAQFAAILLKFPEVMGSVTFNRATNKRTYLTTTQDGNRITGSADVTQANLLDEILAMHGVEI